MINPYSFDFYLLLPLIGFTIGLFGSMLGGGGGFFFLPILTLFFKVPAHMAVATSLAATLPICFLGSLGHYRRRNIDIRTGAMFIVAGVIGALSGAGLTSLLSSKQLKVSFGIYSIAIAIYLSYSTWKKKKEESSEGEVKSLPKGLNIARGSFFGLLAGTIAGTFGTSGTAPVLAGLFAMRIPIKLVVGTSLIIVLVNTVFALGGHFLIGDIDLKLVYPLSFGSVIGALSGPRLLHKIKIERAENSIRYWFAAIMVVLGTLMMIK